jgi:hypothetical protein
MLYLLYRPPVRVDARVRRVRPGAVATWGCAPGLLANRKKVGQHVARPRGTSTCDVNVPRALPEGSDAEVCCGAPWRPVCGCLDVWLLGATGEQGPAGAPARIS